ncbi:class I SAM-dependent methyltransferase [Coxiella burnetii]|uniref:class I SAM-dependent methyltransferase n=1 Tax=Coxiella burnetii TaxID=777 RepID=UPI00030BFD49|nr:SAM-dependent methyltransferase [Coxiella burnetii]
MGDRFSHSYSGIISPLLKGDCAFKIKSINMQPNDLPYPDPIANAHSEQLRLHIVREIAENGPLTFARYMQLALYAPGLGYYSAGSRKFGAAGDFVTAPEISSLFSQCVARQCQQILIDLNGGDILELGAGSGRMAADILRELQHTGCLPHNYFILEISADLRDRQEKFIKNEIPELSHRVKWLNRLPSPHFKGVILGNEVIDAMPVHKFKIDNGIKEVYVNWKNEQFVWEIGEPSAALSDYIKNLTIHFPEGYESEVNLLLKGWIASLADILQEGLILLIDYGFPRHEYYHTDRDRGTIACHYRHHSHFDPLILTGIQDITAHVDFTAIAEAAAKQGLAVEGFTHQAGFLLNCGIATLMPQVEDVAEHYRIAQEIKKLTLPGEMGELFKAIALTRNYRQSLLGFIRMNQVERLSGHR